VPARGGTPAGSPINGRSAIVSPKNLFALEHADKVNPMDGNAITAAVVLIHRELMRFTSSRPRRADIAYFSSFGVFGITRGLR
jgi:hypothetical protein